MSNQLPHNNQQIIPSRPLVIGDIVSSAHHGFDIFFRLKLSPSDNPPVLFRIRNYFIVLPFAYHVPGYRKKKRFMRETEPWLSIRQKLIDNDENRLRIKMIDADIELSKTTIANAFDVVSPDLHHVGVAFQRAMFTLDCSEFQPYNVTMTIAKFLLKLQMVCLSDEATDNKFKIAQKLLCFELPQNEQKRFMAINKHIMQNKSFIQNWKLEIDERRAIVHRMALSRKLSI